MTLIGIVLLLLLAASFWGTPLLDSAFGAGIEFSEISALLLALGAALIGAAALAFTLVMFAMQVNVERLPHALFRRFSTDALLLSCFAAMFLIALGVTLSSLFAETISIGVAILIAIWACLLIAALLWITYRRALMLISPWSQLQLMVASTSRHLQKSVRRAEFLKPLLELDPDDKQDHAGPVLGPRIEVDKARTTIFNLDPNWASEANRAVTFAVSFATRFAEAGDYETSARSLEAILRINIEYIEAKGKTFVGNSPFASLIGQSIGGRDSFVVETLEHLRQYMQVALGRRDEQQVEQAFAAFMNLVRVYLGIEYAYAGESNYYAVLGAGYLSSAVERVASLKSADVLMDGVQKVGTVERLLIANRRKSNVSTTSEVLHKLAASSLFDRRLQVVVGTIMEEYVEILLALFMSRESEVRFEAQRLQGSVSQVVTLILQTPEASIISEHSSYASAFYSTSNMSSLCAKLAALTNAILKAEADDADAGRIVWHVQEWAKELWKQHRDLLQLAVKRRSHLTFDLIHWISRVSQILVALATAPVTRFDLAADLRKSASWLALTLSWIPQDKDSNDLAENYGLTEQLFEVARTAQARQAADISEEIQKVMLDRGCSIAAPEGSGRMLTKVVQGLCALAVQSDRVHAILELQRRLEKRLTEANNLSQEYRNQTARWIFNIDHDMSGIGVAMSHLDQQQLNRALEACAAALAGPDTMSDEAKP